MADIPKEKLRAEINAILKHADLDTTTSKKVRIQLQEKFKCDLLTRKKEIDSLVMDYVNSKQADPESEPGKSDGNVSEDDFKPKKVASSSKKAKKRAASGSGDNSDGDWKKKKPAAKRAKGKGTGFTRPYQLSPQLAAVVGADSLPRHEVVKKIWAIIKERNLYDPKNKQFAICDKQLQTVIGVKRFRTFGMLKYLKTHFID